MNRSHRCRYQSHSNIIFFPLSLPFFTVIHDHFLPCASRTRFWCLSYGRHAFPMTFPSCSNYILIIGPVCCCYCCLLFVAFLLIVAIHRWRSLQKEILYELKGCFDIFLGRFFLWMIDEFFIGVAGTNVAFGLKEEEVETEVVVAAAAAAADGNNNNNNNNRNRRRYYVFFSQNMCRCCCWLCCAILSSSPSVPPSSRPFVVVAGFFFVVVDIDAERFFSFAVFVFGNKVCVPHTPTRGEGKIEIIFVIIGTMCCILEWLAITFPQK